jgi:uncharacterized membrane protein YtjA (UPF0391 family)
LNSNDEKNPYLIFLRRNFQAISKRHDFSAVIFIPEIKNLRIMIRSAITFLIISVIAGVAGFGIVGGGAAVIAQTIFFISIVMLLVSLLSTPPPSRSIDA